MFVETVRERSENVRKMLRINCIKILEGVWVLGDIVIPVQSAFVGVTFDLRLAHKARASCMGSRSNNCWLVSSTTGTVGPALPAFDARQHNRIDLATST